MTEELVEHVKRFEGWVPHVYKCPAGYDTIGYGHRVDDPAHPPITKEEGEALLREDLQHYEDMALRLSPTLAHEPRRLAAITDFCFNLGGARYSGSMLRVMVKLKNWPKAAEQNGRWVYYHPPGSKEPEKLQGLVDRRAVTSRWLREG